MFFQGYHHDIQFSSHTCSLQREQKSQKLLALSGIHSPYISQIGQLSLTSAAQKL